MLENLFKFGLIAADTSRSRAYLYNLNSSKLLPSQTIVLTGGGKTVFGKQEEFQSGSKIDIEWPEAGFDPNEPILEVLEKLGLDYVVKNVEDVNHASVIKTLCDSNLSLFVFSGFGGNLLREGILRTQKYFLHVHGGLLPQFGGSTSNYYSLLKVNEIGASAIFLNAKIDNGPLIFKESFPPPKNLVEFDHVYDPAVRSRVLVKALRLLSDGGCEKYLTNANYKTDQYFVIHPLLKHLAIFHSKSRNLVK